MEKGEKKWMELWRRLKEVEAENIVLRELAQQSEQRYEQVKQLTKENEELRRRLEQLLELEKAGSPEEERPDSWFFRTLRQEKAISSRRGQDKEK
ncbi:spore coat protein regulator protein YlbO [Caldibacillus thermoamylovorans]